MPLIPNLLPVTMAGRTYVDLRTLSGPNASDDQKALWLPAATLTKALLEEIPPELLCENPSVSAEEQGRRTTVPDLPFEAMMGDIDPIYMVAFEGGRCVDAWGMFAIVLTQAVPPFIRIQCRGVPGFPELIDNTTLDESVHQPYAEAVVDLFEFLAATQFELADDRQRLEILELNTALFYLTSGEITPADVRMRLVDAEEERRAPGHQSHDVRRLPYKADVPGQNRWTRWEVKSRRNPL